MRMIKPHKRRAVADTIAFCALIGTILLAIGLLCSTGETDIDGKIYLADKPAPSVSETVPARAAPIAAKPIVFVTPSPEAESEPVLTYIGKLQIYGYTPTCRHCCGKTDGVTASGVIAEIGRTVAMKGYPFGTEIYIDGLGYFVVEDRGVGKGVVDVACVDHKACYAVTSKRDVYVVEGSKYDEA